MATDIQALLDAPAPGERLVRLSELDALIAASLAEHSSCERRRFAGELAEAFERMRPSGRLPMERAVSGAFESAARVALKLAGLPVDEPQRVAHG